MFSQFIFAAVFAALSISAVSAAEPPAGQVTVGFDRPLPNKPGKSQKGRVVR